MSLQRIDRELRPLVRRLLAQGWRIRNGKRHAILYPPNGKIGMPVPGSAGDHRTAHNFRAYVRRAQAVS